MNFNGLYGSSYGYGGGIAKQAVVLIIAAILAVVGGLVVYFVFMPKSKEGQYTGFLKYCYDFLHFRVLWLEALLKILYAITASFLLLYGVLSIFIGQPVVFITVGVLGNIVARISYEFTLMLLVIVRNTTDINEKLGPKKHETRNHEIKAPEVKTPEAKIPEAENNGEQ